MSVKITFFPSHEEALIDGPAGFTEISMTEDRAEALAYVLEAEFTVWTPPHHDAEAERLRAAMLDDLDKAERLLAARLVARLNDLDTN